MFTARHTNTYSYGFTLVELMVVMAVMATLATVSLYGYGNVRQKSKAVAEILQIMKAARLARAQQDKVLGQITSYCSACSCWNNPPSSWSSAACKAQMDAMFPLIGITAGAMLDPWGCYYSMDENELEGSSTNCTRDYFYYHCGTESKSIPTYSSQCEGSP